MEDTEVCVHSAEGGRLDVLQWAREKGYAWDAKSYSRAAETGNLEILKWAKQNEYPWDGSECVPLVASHLGGDMAATKWLHECGFMEWMMWIDSDDEEWNENKENECGGKTFCYDMFNEVISRRPPEGSDAD